MMRFLLVIGLLIGAHGARAQYFQFSQYNYAAQRISPTAPAESDFARLSFLYRNQGTGADIRLNTNFLSASYPLINAKTGKRWSGIGATLLDDRSGGIYAIREGSLSYAINIPVAELQTFSLGFKGLYQQRKIDLSGLHTGSQYIPDRGFDETASSGEDIGTFRSNFFTFSTGLSWQQLNREGIRLAYWSLSIFDINKPQDAFIGDDNKLNSTFVASGGFRAYKNSNMSMFPEVLYTRSSANNVLNVGLITRCDVKGQGKQKPFYVDIITKYVVKRSGILGLQFHNENFSMGVSYDILVNRDNTANIGALEVGLELRKLVLPKLKGKTTAAKPPQKPPVTKTVAKQPVKKSNLPAKAKTDSVKRTIPPKKNLATTLEMKRDSVVANTKAGEIAHQPFVLEKITLHFNFEFNSSELDEASTQYLDDLKDALLQDEHLRVKLTGHTDNIGNAKFNHRLSLHRANAIKEYLVSKGVDAGRIETEGKGLTEPLNDNQTEEGRAKNRRVELTILYEE
jgi:type IX secretion system PorP/SprF family membrane protein